MKYHRLFLTALLTAVLRITTAQVANAPDKHYTNPVGQDIYMGDPFILFHDGIYYLYGTTSSGEGFKCWSSKDFREWKPEGFVYRKTETSWGGSNFWAPEVYFHKGEFYLAYSSKGKDSNNRMLLCLAKSPSPTGPFTDVHAPWFDMGFSCIDAHLFFDDDGKIYLYFDRVGYEGKQPDGYMYGLIYVMETDSQLRPSGDTIFCSKAEQDWENPLSMHSRCNEGSYVLKHNGKYYMTYSANHYLDPFYGIGYSTAPTPLGPWEKCKDNPLVGMNPEAGIFGPGHNSFTVSPDGKELFMVYHTHVSEKDKKRQVNIDRVEFDATGKLILRGPTRTPQRVP
jgi:GH43 family beta-xylosidase